MIVSVTAEWNKDNWQGKSCHECSSPSLSESTSPVGSIARNRTRRITDPRHPLESASRKLRCNSQWRHCTLVHSSAVRGPKKECGARCGLL